MGWKVSEQVPIVVSTVDYADHDKYRRRIRVIANDGAELVRTVRLLRALRRADAAILDSSSGHHHPDLLALAALPAVRRRPPPVVLMGCMWQPDAGIRGWLQRRLVRRADRCIARYAVQSSDEAVRFPEIWGIDPEKVRVNLYFWTLSDAEAQSSSEPEGSVVFAGGDSHRDYAPLVEAARSLPDTQFILATSQLDGVRDLPRNVQAGHLTHERFMEALATASIVVVPMAAGLHRAAGQQTYLNAMRLGKAVVVRDGPGVHDHIRHGIDGIVVDGTSAAYVAALKRLLDAQHGAELAELRTEAQARAEVFTFEDHAERLLEILDEVVAALPAR